MSYSITDVLNVLNVFGLECSLPDNKVGNYSAYCVFELPRIKLRDPESVANVIRDGFYSTRFGSMFKREKDRLESEINKGRTELLQVIHTGRVCKPKGKNRWVSSRG